jgi:hypothetical protein
VGCVLDRPDSGGSATSDRAGTDDVGAGQGLDPSDDTGWWVEVQQRIAAEEYRITEQGPGRWNVANRAHDLRAVIEGGAATITPRDGEGWTATLSVAGLGRRDGAVDRAPMPSRAEPGECDEAAEPGATADCLRRLDLDRGTFVEWWRNGVEGIEHGLDVAVRPGGTGDLVVRVRVEGLEAEPDGDTGALLREAGELRLSYAGLEAVDAEGVELPARMEVTPDEVLLVVDDSDAVYPIVIDPLLTTPAWTAEADQIGASYGSSVASAGDVNGDGYGDVIVGAPYFDDGQTDEGRAFVYHGSATGLSAAAAWSAESDQMSASYGISVASAGDVNGDGYADVIIGSQLFDGGQPDEGRAYVYHGSATGLGAAAAWTAESNQAAAHFGISVASAGDVNGDGFSDVVVGASDYDNGQPDEGRVFVYHGSAAGLAAVADWTTESDQGGAYMGTSVASAGDVNGDGYSDVIVGATGFDGGHTDEGRAFVFHGSATGLGAAAAWTAEIDQAWAWFGRSVASAGDVNGDGYADVIVGASWYDHGQTDEGGAFVYHGSATGLGAAAAWTTESNQANANYGTSVASAGDVNGDGYADVIVGALQYDNGQTDEGRAYAYHGSASGLSTTAAWTAESNQASAYFGGSVASAGDVNGDGYADVVVGAYRFDNGQIDEGRAFLYHGSAAGLATAAAWTGESNQASAEFGISLAPAGDVNGDGYADVVVGASSFDNGQTNEGRAFVFLGSATGLAAAAAWTAESDQASAFFGGAVASAGDVNGDGFADVIVGAYLFDNGQTDEGRAFVFLGSATGLEAAAAWTAEGDQVNASFGVSVASAGDVNGDGYSDIVVGAYQFDNGQTDEGRAFVYHGSAAGLAAAAAWTAESNQASALFGGSVASAGDVNGDGFTDVVVGARQFDAGQTDEGRAFVFHGSATGLGATAAWTAESNQASASFGVSVASAGDVNGDGYSDVIVGAHLFDNGQTDEGRAFVYHGSATGLAASAAWTAEINATSAYFGYSVASAGDVDGDGYADVLVGAYRATNGQTNEGRTFLYNGNGGRGLSLTPRQDNADGAPRMQAFAMSEGDGVRLLLQARSDRGRTRVRLEWEIERPGARFDGAGLGRSAAGTDTGAPADGVIDVAQAVAGPNRNNRWRARLLYPGGHHSRWMVFDRIGSWLPDFRVALADGLPCTADGDCASEHCADGVCCATACGGGAPDDCQACSVARGGTLDGSCTALADAVAPTVTCRAEAPGGCDAAETCAAASTECPADAFRAAGFECRASAGGCDVAETCPGDATACPDDVLRAAGFECRAAAGGCDVAETCTGDATTCPDDVLRATGFECRATAGDCDLAETCTGVDAECPGDAFVAAGTECRATAGVCDVRETCPGDAAACPDDAFVAAGARCAEPSCVDGTEWLASTCSGDAAPCPEQASAPCDPFICGDTACLDDCDAAGDCLPDHWCDGSMCHPIGGPGDPCEDSIACRTDFCVDGVCCEGTCLGQCEACDVEGSEGECVPVEGDPHGDRDACTSDGTACGGSCDGVEIDGCAYPGEDVQCRAPSCADGVAVLEASCIGAGRCPDERTQVCAPYACADDLCDGDCSDDVGCAAGYFCSAGVCVEALANGEACDRDGMCADGHCADGVCCDASCEGQCEACDVAGSEGACSPVTGDPHGGRDACGGSGECAGTCDGTATDACSMPGAETECSEGSCADGVLTPPGTCDGAGWCQDPEAVPCDPYICADEVECLTSCDGDEDCVEGLVCEDDACVPGGGDGDADSDADADGDGDTDGDGDIDADADGDGGDGGGCDCGAAGRASTTSVSVVFTLLSGLFVFLLTRPFGRPR